MESSLVWWTIGAIIIVFFIVIAVLKSIAAHRAEIKGGAESLIGLKGTAKSDINPRGKFYTHGEYWDAVAQGEPLKAGERGRVVAVEAKDEKYLIVEKINE